MSSRITVKKGDGWNESSGVEYSPSEQPFGDLFSLPIKKPLSALMLILLKPFCTGGRIHTIQENGKRIITLSKKDFWFHLLGNSRTSNFK